MEEVAQYVLNCINAQGAKKPRGEAIWGSDYIGLRQVPPWSLSLRVMDWGLVSEEVLNSLVLNKC